jgi:hypothetical protein
MLAPNPWLAAFKAFGHLASISTEEQAQRFIEIGRELVPRRPNSYRFTDEDHVHGLIGIARAHPELRDEAVDQLLQALLLDQRMARLTLGHGHDLLRDDPAKTVAAVVEAAAEGNLYAAMALVAAEDDTTQAVPLARQRLEAAVAPRIHTPGVQTFGTGLPQTAGLMTVLPEEDRVRFARGMLEFANDQQETANNRYEALIALQAVARYVPDDVRDELFEQVLPFAEGRYEAAEGDTLFPGADDPLQRFRFSLGDASLAPAGLTAAAALARAPAQYATIQQSAVAQLRHATDQTAHQIAVALASLPPEQVTLPVELLAGHPSPWVRALAAVVWAQRPDQPEEIGVRLAQDPSREVRESLTGSLGDDHRHANVRAVLAGDPRRSVRWHVEGAR